VTRSIILDKHPDLSGQVVSLPSSKSLSNRALMINALSENPSSLLNLSQARDTQLMSSLVNTPNEVIDVHDAGTAARFLTTLFSIKGLPKTIRGTERMHERPIGNLVDALRTLGATIDYLDKQGFLPVAIRGFSPSGIDTLTIQGDISSQFLSALMMIGPSLKNGLTIKMTGNVGSRPYLTMTATLMAHFGATATVRNDSIRVPAGRYLATEYLVEHDWSAASYWFAFVALAKKAEVFIPGLKSVSMQGDRIVVAIMSQLGVASAFSSEGLRLSKQAVDVDSITWDFSGCPDLAQTVLPVCAALGIPGEFKGMESLRLKETDRIFALQQELGKVGATLTGESGYWKLTPGRSPADFKSLSIETYHDHRMAMGFAPWSTLTRLDVEHPDVVQKSYPGFWDDLKNLQK